MLAIASVQLKNLLLDLLDTPTKRRGFDALPIHDPRKLLLEPRECVIDDIGMQDLRLQTRKELALEQAPGDQQVIPANAVAAVGVHRAPVARIVAFSPLARNDCDAAAADGTLQQAGEEIRRS